MKTFGSTIDPQKIREFFGTKTLTEYEFIRIMKTQTA